MKTTSHRQVDILDAVSPDSGTGAVNRKRWRRVVRWLLILLTSVFVLVGALLVFLHTAPGKAFVRSRIENTLSKRLTGRVDIGSLDYGFLFSWIRLDDVQVFDRHGQPIAAIDSVQVELNRLSVLDGAPRIPSLTARGVTLSVRQYSDHTTNVTGLINRRMRVQRRVRIQDMAIHDIDIAIHRADGVHAAIRIPTIRGHADMDTVARKAAIEVTQVALSATFHRPDGSTLVAHEFSSTARIDAHGADLSMKLSNIRGLLELVRPTSPRIDIPISIAEATVDRTVHGITAALDLINARPVRADKLAVTLERAHGDQLAIATAKAQGVKLEHLALNSLVGRPVLASDITLDLTGSPHDDGLTLAGRIRTERHAITINGSITTQTGSVPVYELHLTSGRLRADNVLGPALFGPASSIDSAHTDIRIIGRGLDRDALDVRMTGSLAALSVAEFTMTDLQFNIALADRRVHIENLQWHLFGTQVDVRGHAHLDTGDIDAHLALHGHLGDAIADARTTRWRLPRRLPRVGQASLNARIRGQPARTLDIDIDPSTVRVFGGRLDLDGSIRLTGSGNETLQPTDAALQLRMHGLRLHQLAAVAGRRMKHDKARLYGTVHLSGRDNARFNMRIPIVDPPVSVTANGILGGRTLALEYAVRRDGDNAELFHGDAAIPLRGVGGRKRLASHRAAAFNLHAASRAFAEWERLIPLERWPRRLANAELPDGRVSLDVRLAGTPASPTGTLVLAGELDGMVTSGRKKTDTPQAFKLAVHSSAVPAGSRLDVSGGSWTGDAVDSPLVTLGGTADIPHLFVRGVPVPHLAEGTRLRVFADMSPRPPPALSHLIPQLERLPGQVAMRMDVTGTAIALIVEARSVWDKFNTVAGVPGRVVTSFAMRSPSDITADLVIGAPSSPVEVVARISPSKDRVDVKTTMRARGVPFTSVVPAFLVGGRTSADAGHLNWDMTSVLSVDTTHKRPQLSIGTVEGTLDIDGGQLPIPGSERVIHDMQLHVTSSRDALTIRELSARETDTALGAHPPVERSASISAELHWDNLRPRRADITIQAERALLFGPEALGVAESPKAEMSANLRVGADLSTPIPTVSVTIDRLSLSAPDRYVRNHVPLTSSVNNDVLFTDGTDIAPGTFPRPADTTRPALSIDTPVDLDLRIPNPIHVHFAPGDGNVQGDVSIAIRPGRLPSTRGQLELIDANLQILGNPHRLEHGTVTWSDRHPDGILDIAFRGNVSRTFLRHVSAASAGSDGLIVKLEGPLAAPRLSLDGVAGSEIFEAMLAENAGHTRHVTQPDMPAGPTVSAPHVDQHLVLTFIAVNVPHLRLFDRFAAWADPYDSDDAYGRVEHFTGERKSGKHRIEIVSRPPTPGRSQLEVHADRLFIDDRTRSAGVGVRIGSRVGGGVSLFFEWSSRN